MLPKISHLALGQQCEPILPALAVPNQQFTTLEVKIFHP